MTNADVIRAMSDDELADYLYKQIYPDQEPGLMGAVKYNAIRNFLKKEAKEDEGRG